MSVLKEIGLRIENILHPSSGPTKPHLTEEVAQQMRDEAEYGSMYLPDKLTQSLERTRSQRPPINDPRSTKQNG